MHDFALQGPGSVTHTHCDPLHSCIDAERDKRHCQGCAKSPRVTLVRFLAGPEGPQCGKGRGLRVCAARLPHLDLGSSFDTAGTRLPHEDHLNLVLFYKHQLINRQPEKSLTPRLAPESVPHLDLGCSDDRAGTPQ